MTDATITPTDNGAYMVEGPLRVVDADGTEYELSQQTTILLCRCGHSSTKALVDVFAAVGASEKAAAVVEPGKGALDDPPLAAEPGAMLSLTARDDRLDAPLPDEPASRG
jgi:CDGSH-type Zn-finger protein